MQNLNAEQIKKALEWCSELRLCVDCPMRAEGYFSHSGNACRQALMKNALALIKSQEQRIKELTDENESLRADKDYWKKRAKESESEYDQAVKRGYKLGAVDYVYSFVEKLKAETITIQDHMGKLGLVVLVSDIDKNANELLNGEGMCNEK